MTKDAGTKKLLTVLFMFMAVFYIFANNPLSEVFYWYTGICAYTLPLSLALISVADYILYNENKKLRYIIAGSIYAVMAGGGSLNIGTLLCGLLLFCVVYDRLTEGKFDKNIIIGIAALLSTVVTVAAPGNFARHSSYVASISPATCLYYSVSQVGKMISEGFASGFLTVIIVVSFVVSYNIFKNTERKFVLPVLVALFSYAGMVTVLFPVCLGYSSKFIPERCMFVQYLTVYILLVLASGYIAGWCADKKIFEFTNVSYLILALVCIVPMARFLDNDNLRELIPVRMFWHMASGDYKTVEARELWLLNELEQAADEDVVIYVQAPPEGEWTNIKGVGLIDDPDFWLNEGVAAYYGKNSVIVITQGGDETLETVQE